MASDSAKGLAGAGEYNTRSGTSFNQATTIRRDGDDSTYQAEIPSDWCFGPVAHGGYLSGLLSRVVEQHLQSLTPVTSYRLPETLSSCNTIYLAPVLPGVATIKIETRSIGRKSAHFIASLYQGSATASSATNGLVSDRNLRVEAIVFMSEKDRSSKYALSELMRPHKRIPVLEMFRRHPKGRHVPHDDSGMSFYKHKPGWECYFRPDSIDKQKMLNRHPQHGPAVFDVWWKFDHNITVHELGFLADLIGPVLFNYEEIRKTYWLSTRQMGVEIVRLPQPEQAGWQWLFCRMELIENVGDQFHCDVTIADEQGNVVAIARQSCIPRPYALVGKRKKREASSAGSTKSKI